MEVKQGTDARLRNEAGRAVRDLARRRQQAEPETSESDTHEQQTDLGIGPSPLLAGPCSAAWPALAALGAAGPLPCRPGPETGAHQAVGLPVVLQRVHEAREDGPRHLCGRLCGDRPKSIELVGPDQWPVLQKHGLICAMTPSHSIPKGLNRVENHDECLSAIRKSIDATAAAGFPQRHHLSGNRDGLDDDGVRRRPGEVRGCRRREERPSAWSFSTHQPQGLHGRLDRLGAWSAASALRA